MTPKETLFNHVGLAVTDMQRSRAFYENALGFKYWWELTPADLPEKESAQMLRLGTPLGLHAVYLVKDGFVLELLAYHPDRYEPWRKRSMAEPGLTHISLAVEDVGAAIELAEKHGGQAIPETNSDSGAMVRDPDGQLIEFTSMAFLDMRPPMPT